MGRPESPTVTRRRYLGAVGGGTLAGLAGQSGTPEEYGPLGRVTVRGAKEAVVADGVAYVAATDGFATVDVSDPHSPRLLAERRDLLADRDGGPMQQVYDAKVDDDRLLVVGPANPLRDVPRAVLLYDVSDPAAPERLAVHETGYPIHNCVLEDGVAYLTGNDGDANPLVMLDAGSGEELGRWSLVDADAAWGDVPPILRSLHDVWVQGGLAYLAHWDAGTWVVDVSDPGAPRTVAQVRGRGPEELAAVPTVRTEQLERPGNDHYVAVNEDASLLGVGTEAWDDGDTDTEGGPGGIELWDVSDLDAPRRLSTIDPPPTPDASFGGVWTTAHNFEFGRGHLYSAWYRGGVRVHDVSDPTAPVERRSWRETEGASFWTARSATPGEFFVASSVGSSGALSSRLTTPSDGDEPAGLYTFPDPSDGTPTATTGTGTGLGVLAGVAGLGLGAWLLRRRSRT